MLVTCKCCNKEFYISPSRLGKRFYCSRKCFHKIGHPNRNRSVKLNCSFCGKEFKRNISRQSKTDKTYCSYKCFYSAFIPYNKGKNLSYIVWNKGKKMLPQQSGKNASGWRGGRFISNGYVYIYTHKHPSNYNGHYLEHRLVAEKCLGRYLKKYEIIHHINNDRSDNRPKNLYLFSNQKKHFIFHFNPHPLTSNII